MGEEKIHFLYLQRKDTSSHGPSAYRTVPYMEPETCFCFLDGNGNVFPFPWWRRKRVSVSISTTDGKGNEFPFPTNESSNHGLHINPNNEIVNKNSKTGKMTVVVKAMKVLGSKYSNSQYRFKLWFLSTENQFTNVRTITVKQFCSDGVFCFVTPPKVAFFITNPQIDLYTNIIY